MKFIEYFERSWSTNTRLLLLGGEDTTLKNSLRLEFIKQSGLQKEYSQTGNVQDLISNMEAGGFFGPRLFDVFFDGKVKNPVLWNMLFEAASISSHTMILCFEGDGGDWTDLTFKNHSDILWFNCKFPKDKREKIKLITLLLRYRNIILENTDLIKEIATRVKSSLELENFLTCLKLLLEYQHKVTSKDLRALLGKIDQGYSSAHYVMSGDVPKLLEVIETEEYSKILPLWIWTLKKFYIWLCTDTLETGAPGKDDDEDEVKDPAALSRYQLREYRIAKHRYSLMLVREVLEELNSIWQDVCVGRDNLWRERAKIAVQRLAIKA